jgi:hypothetical protein
MSLQQIKQQWSSRWNDALALWSKFTKLSEPRWCLSDKEADKEDLTTSFAMIRFADQAVVINLEEIQKQNLEKFSLEIMAHEIGHHVYCPADLADQGRMLARMRKGLPTKEHLAGLVANLYADLLINDRLQRSANLKMADVFKTLGGDSQDRLWTFYMRIYEILWSLPKTTLAKGKIDDQLEGDAQLGARVIRVYAKDWLKGSGRFAALCLTYLMEDEGTKTKQILKGWLDTQSAGNGDSIPAGLVEIEDGEIEDAIHPSLDEEVTGISRKKESEGNDTVGISNSHTLIGNQEGQCREPFEFGEILKGLGVNLSPHEVAIRYYRERAIPHLVKFPYSELPETIEPLMESLDVWEIGESMEDIDWFESAMVSPVIVPGYTTVQRIYGTTVGSMPEREPVDLDLYIDCSGSMPNPQYSTSYLALAGAIIALSALRAGSSVQATLWSGKHQFQVTDGFVRDETEILKIITGFIGGATAFPIHLLRDTYKDHKPTDRPVHILTISDDGIDTMFDTDEKGNNGWDVAKMALEKGRGGGTMVLNLWREWKDYPVLVKANEQGWSINRVTDWAQLVEFAKRFSEENYAKK